MWERTVFGIRNLGLFVLYTWTCNPKPQFNGFTWNEFFFARSGISEIPIFGNYSGCTLGAASIEIDSLIRSDLFISFRKAIIDRCSDSYLPVIYWVRFEDLVSFTPFMIDPDGQPAIPIRWKVQRPRLFRLPVFQLVSSLSDIDVSFAFVNKETRSFLGCVSSANRPVAPESTTNSRQILVAVRKCA